MTLHPGVRTRIDQIENLYGVGLSDLKNGGSFRRFVQPRQHFWAMLQQDGFSLPRAARVTGHHHTTVLYGIRQFQARAALNTQEKAA